MSLAEDSIWDQTDFIEISRPPADLHGTNPTAPAAAQALTVVGAPAVPALLKLLEEASDSLEGPAEDTASADRASSVVREASEAWVLCVLALDALGLMSGLSALTRRLTMQAICTLLPRYDLLTVEAVPPTAVRPCW